MMSRGDIYFTVAKPGGASRGTMEHTEGKDGESAVTILRFLCGSLCACWLRTAPFLAPTASLELCTDHISGFYVAR
jgi:hypothetical protein